MKKLNEHLAIKYLIVGPILILVILTIIGCGNDVLERQYDEDKMGAPTESDTQESSDSRGIKEPKGVIVIGRSNQPLSNLQAGSLAFNLDLSGVPTETFVPRESGWAKKPRSSWSAVREELADADVIVYYGGHGAGTDEGIGNVNDMWGIYIDQDRNFPLGDNRREGKIGREIFNSDVKLKDNCLVCLNDTCYSAGSTDTDPPEGVNEATARSRIENYADTFLKYNKAEAYVVGMNILFNMIEGCTLKEALDRFNKDRKQVYGIDSVVCEYPYEARPGYNMYFTGRIEEGRRFPYWDGVVIGDLNLTLKDVVLGR